MSTVNYLLTSYDNFNQLSDFEVLDFLKNSSSNHAPITCSFNTMTNLQCTNNTKRTFYRWDKQHKLSFLSDITAIQTLEQTLTNEISAGSNSDALVNIFTDFLSDMGNKYFEKTTKPKNHYFMSEDKK